MRILSELKALAAEAKQLVHGLVESNYTTSFDEQFNLTIKFHDGEVCRIPMIDLRPYQLVELAQLFGGFTKRMMLQWPRRSGKEVFTWTITLIAALIKPGMYIMAYPTNVRAKKILWQGSALIHGVSVKFLKMIPKRLIAKQDNGELTIELINGSIIWIVGCDIDPDKLRGTNPLGLAACELAFADPHIIHAMMPVLRQNGGWLIGQSTYNGMNHFYWMIENNKNNPLWRCRSENINTLLDENGNPYITDADVDEDRQAGMPEYLIQQEYYGNVSINEETKYFSVAIKAIQESNRIIQDLFLPQKNVYAFFDIGVDDCTSITIAQFENVGRKMNPKVIGYFENNNRDLLFYVTEVRQFCNRYNLPLHSFYFPHDGKNRNFNDGLKNTLNYLAEMGERGFFVERPKSHITAIEKIRQLLFRSEFNRANTVRLIECLSNYGKEYDDKMLKFKDTPLHDWSSHGVKSFQTMALALEANLINEICYDVVYMNG